MYVYIHMKRKALSQRLAASLDCKHHCPSMPASLRKGSLSLARSSSRTSPGSGDPPRNSAAGICVYVYVCESMFLCMCMCMFVYA